MQLWQTIVSVRERYLRILDTCQPYLVTSAYGSTVASGTLPLDLEIPADLQFDPRTLRSGPFLHMLQRLDELTFGPVGMTMPRWVFYDCAEVPGLIFGFARSADAVPEWVRRALDVEDGYSAPLPLSMYMAIPMIEPGCWHTYTLCSLNQVAPGAGPAGLDLFTAGVGLQTFGIQTAYGTTQWRSPKLAVHARFGPLELVTAWTPAHSDPTTLTFHFPVLRARIDRALMADEPPLYADGRTIVWIDCDDIAALQQLQADIERGRRLQIVGGPVITGSYTRVPVCEVASR